MKLSDLKRIVGDGKFFSVKFVRRGDGHLRVMNCRVKPPVKGGSGMCYDPDQHDLLVVWDIHRRGYRTIPADNILELTHHGQRTR